MVDSAQHSGTGAPGACAGDRVFPLEAAAMPDVLVAVMFAVGSTVVCTGSQGLPVPVGAAGLLWRRTESGVCHTGVLPALRPAISWNIRRSCTVFIFIIFFLVVLVGVILGNKK
jgi:hypothetical protein